MKIVQLLPVMSYGDAIGNDVLAIRSIIHNMGYTSDIYADAIGPHLKNENIIHFDSMVLSPSDILIYHLSTGSRLNRLIEQFYCKKIAIYHNITPSNYFLGYDIRSYAAAKAGLKEIKHLKDKFDYCLTDSEFNKEDLLSYGYTCKIDVLPIVVPISEYAKKPAPSVLRKYADTMVNLLFVGRVVPNKKIESVIQTLYHYYGKYNAKSRLFLVGKCLESYRDKLEEYIRVLGLRNVIFTGHVKFQEILAYYSLSDVFVCMSEHEGFCVPLVEAMYFGLPIVAAPHAAIPSTLGGSGILLDESSPLLAAGVVDRLIRDKGLRGKVAKDQRKRLEDFSYPTVKHQFETYLNEFLRSMK